MKTYDFVFSLGFSCGTSQALRAAGLQYASYPLDWLGVHDILCSVRAVENGFADWLNVEDMQLVDVRHGSGFQTRAYWNSRTNMGFSHEFSDFIPFEESLPKVRGSYEHRRQRFMTDLMSAKRVLAVWAEQPMVENPVFSQYHEAHARLMSAVPSAEVDLLVFFERPGCGIPEVVEQASGLTVVAADYRKMRDGLLDHFVDYEQFVKYLKSNARMPDPRTEKEKAEYAAAMSKVRAYRWGPGVSRFRQWLNQRAYKAYRYLERVLQRRGFVQCEGPLWFTEDIREKAAEVSR